MGLQYKLNQVAGSPQTLPDAQYTAAKTNPPEEVKDEDDHYLNCVKNAKKYQLWTVVDLWPFLFGLFLGEGLLGVILDCPGETDRNHMLPFSGVS